MRKLDEIRNDLEDARRIASRLRDELRSLTTIWTLVEAFNGRNEDHRLKLHSVITQLGLSATAEALLKALTRDVLSALFRITDAAGPDRERQSFCLLRQIIEKREIASTLEADALSWHGSDDNPKKVRENIEYIKRQIPRDWKNSTPQGGKVLQLRERLRPLRDALLAHAMSYDTLQQPTFGEIRCFVKIASELQAASSLAILGEAEDLQDRWEGRLREANDFWDIMTRPTAP